MTHVAIERSIAARDAHSCIADSRCCHRLSPQRSPHAAAVRTVALSGQPAPGTPAA